MSEVYSSGAWIVKDGGDEAFIEAWTDFARWMRTLPGSGTARLTRDASHPRRYRSFAAWESQEAMDAWRSNDEFRPRLGAVREQVEDFAPSDFELVVEI